MPYVANDPTASRLAGYTGGRNPVWTDPEEMEKQGENYFEIRTAEKKVFTVAGLALHLGLSYQGLSEYQAKPAFSGVVKRLKTRILNQAEEGFYNKDLVNGAKFHAQQLGMSEKSQVETQNTNLNANADINLGALSDADIVRLIELGQKLALPGAVGSGAIAPPQEQDQNPVPGDGGVSS